MKNELPQFELEKNKLITFRGSRLVEQSNRFVVSVSGAVQGCQIFLGTLYHTRKKCTKWTQNLTNGHKISQMSIRYS
jgi:hypothetical protein